MNFLTKNIALTFLLFLHFLVELVICFSDNDLTVDIPAGARSCFFEYAKPGQILEVDFQVIDGGDLDVSFIVQSPQGRPLVTDIKKQDNNHRIEVKEDGDHKLCFDNTFTRFSAKLVYFEIVIYNNDGTEGADDDDDDDWLSNISPDELVDVSVDNLKDSISKVKGNLARSIQLQGLLRVFEAKDRNIMESNWIRVNNWSVIFICVMVGTGLIQVVMIRSLFDDKSRVAQVVRKLKGQG